MSGHLTLTKSLAELGGHPLGQFSPFYENPRGSVAGGVSADAVEDLVELIAGDRGLELAVGQLERQLEAAPVTAVDDRGERLRRSHEQAGRRLEGPDRRRQA